MHNWTPVEDALSRREDSALLQPIEPLELVRDGEDEPPSSVVESGSILLDQASQAALTVEPGKAEELAANPIEWMATAPPEHAEEPADPAPGWDEEVPDAHDSIDLKEPATPEPLSISAIVPEPASAKEEITASAAPIVPLESSEKVAGKTPEPSKTQPSLTATLPSFTPAIAPKLNAPKQSVDDTARSIPRQDWADLAAMLHASQGASEAELDAVAPPAPPVASASTPEQVASSSAV